MRSQPGHGQRRTSERCKILEIGPQEGIAAQRGDCYQRSVVLLWLFGYLVVNVWSSCCECLVVLLWMFGRLVVNVWLSCCECLVVLLWMFGCLVVNVRLSDFMFWCCRSVTVGDYHDHLCVVVVRLEAESGDHQRTPGIASPTASAAADDWGDETARSTRVESGHSATASHPPPTPAPTTAAATSFTELHPTTESNCLWVADAESEEEEEEAEIISFAYFLTPSVTLALGGHGNEMWGGSVSASA